MNISWSPINALMEHVENLSENNIREITPLIAEIFLKKSDELINRLTQFPNEIQLYRQLQHKLVQIDLQALEQVNPFISTIEKIAIYLSNNKTLLPRFDCLSIKNLDVYFSENFMDCGLRAYVTANIVNRDEIPLRNFPKELILEMGPYLRHVDLGQVPNWNVEDVHEILKACPNVTHLIVPGMIQTLPLLPYCEVLNCTHCDQLTHLPELPRCKKLYCDYCSNLMELPQLPLCEILSCSHCPRLVELPALSRCTSLICFNCLSLVNLSKLDHCKTLKCGGCVKLTELPALFLCESLNCSGCISLAELPLLPNCHFLDCQSCYFTELPPLPLCKFLNCFNCFLLLELPFLPICISCGYKKCFSLNAKSIPPKLVTHLIEGVEMFEIKIDELNRNPLIVLLMIGAQLLKGQSIPSIRFIEADGRASEGVDMGGVSRILINKLIQEIGFHSDAARQLSFDRDEHGYSIPVLDFQRGRTPNQINGFRALGALLSFCILNELKIDKLFSPNFYRAIVSFSSEELENMFVNSKELSDEVRFKWFSFYSNHPVVLLLNICPEELNPNQIEELKIFIELERRDESEIPLIFDRLEEMRWIHCEAKRLIIQRTKENDLLLPMAHIANEMRIHLCLDSYDKWEEIRAWGAEKLQEFLEGVISEEEVFNAITWQIEEVISFQDSMKTTFFVKKWLKEANLEDLKKMIFTITGHRCLPNNPLKFELFQRGIHHIPTAQTCFFSLQLSANYPNYRIFKKKWQLLLDQSCAREHSGLELS